MSQPPVLQDEQEDNLQDNVSHQDETKIPIKQSGSSGIAALLRTTKDSGLLKRITAKNGGSMTNIDSADDESAGNHTSNPVLPAHHSKIQRIQSVPCDVPLSSHTGRAPLNSVPSSLYTKSSSTSSASFGDQVQAPAKKQPLLPPSYGYENGRQISTSKMSSSVFSSVSDQSEMSHDHHEGSHVSKEVSPDRTSQESPLSDCFIEYEQYSDSSSDDHGRQSESDSVPVPQETDHETLLGGHNKESDRDGSETVSERTTMNSAPPTPVANNNSDIKKRPMFPPGKSPPTKSHPPAMTSQSVRSASSEMGRQHSASVSMVTSKPVPKPRLKKAATSIDLYTPKSSGPDEINRSLLSEASSNKNVTMAITNEGTMNTNETELDRSSRGISPPARELKFENDVLKQQILHLKQQQSKLEGENSQLREHLEGELDTPTNQGRKGSADSGIHLSNSSAIPFPNSKPHSITAHPRPRSRSVSPVDVRESGQSDLRRSLDDIVLPSTKPVPIPRERGLKSAAAISSSVPTKTFLARTRDAPPTSSTHVTTPITGGLYQRGTEKASSADVGSQSPVPKPRAVLTRPNNTPSQSSKSPFPLNINEEGTGSLDTMTTASASGKDLKTANTVRENQPVVQKNKILAIQTLQKLIPKQPLLLPSSAHIQTHGTKSVPVPRLIGQKDTPPVTVSNNTVDNEVGGVFEKTSEVKVQPSHNLANSKQTLTPSKPLPPVSSTTTSGDKSLTPPKLPASSGEAVNNTSPKLVSGVLYKKMAIKSDVSWIKSCKPSIREDTTDAPHSAPPTTTPTSKIATSASSSKFSPPKKTAPYRSHAILSGPSGSTSSSSILNPGASYSTPATSTVLSGPPTLVTKETKVPPPKIVISRKRTETISNSRKEKDFRRSDKRRHSFTSSTSDDSISSGASEGRNSKIKGRGFMGTKTQSKVKMIPPKKPPRPWLGKGRGFNEEFGGRPMSMLDTTSSSKNRVPSFTTSCTVSTIPRGTDPDEMKEQKAQSPRKRGKHGSDSSLLENGSPGKSSRSKFGLFKTKQKLARDTLAPPLEEDESDSSDDEKGGTIKYMPKLRHVSVKKSLSLDDDEPEYHQLFQYVFVVGLKEVSKGKLATEMTYTFPPATCPFSGKDAALQSIPQFCFPDIEQWKPTKSYQSESFSFVLTDMEGHRRFGYCRRLLPDGSKSRLPECYCIVSPLGCFSLYESILDHVERRRAVSSMAVFTFLKAIVANPFPRPGRSVEVRPFSADGKGLETLQFGRPMDSRLEHVSFSLLFSTLSQRKVIKLFSSLLMERRVIFCAHSLSLLSGCAHALMALLYPFEWQHVFIPVLPSSLIDFVCSPLPYIIGISPACIKQIDTMETMEEAVIIDLDKKKFIRQIGDEASILPSKLFQYLEHTLSSSAISSEYSKKSSSKKAATSRADDIVVNTFMKFFAYLFGDYKTHMKTLNPATRERELQRSEFIHKFSSKSTRRFLDAFLRTQMFEEFIEQRENPNKAETTAQSLFERRLPELKDKCQEIEIFSSKSRFDRWKIKKGLAKK